MSTGAKICLWVVFAALCVVPDWAAVITIEQKPDLDTRYGTVLKFYRMNADFPVYCSLPEVAGSAIRLDTNAVYKFTLFDAGWMDQALLKIENGTLVVFDASKCEVHGTKMEFKRVPIVYGLLRTRTYGLSAEAFAKLERNTFPHYEEIVGGGCVSDSKSPRHSHVWLCKDCKAAFAKWQARQDHSGD